MVNVENVLKMVEKHEKEGPDKVAKRLKLKDAEVFVALKAGGLNDPEAAVFIGALCIGLDLCSQND